MQDLLKIYRKKNKLTQAQVATELFVTVQAVSKWEKGRAIPSIDNLVSLADLFNLSLDELVQGSPFFKKPFVVGAKYNVRKGVTFLLAWTFISLLLTGFGYQPLGLFLFVFLFGIVQVFPTVFTDYWVIENKGIRKKEYAKNNGLKCLQLLRNQQAEIFINYADIYSVELVYEVRERVSLVDFQRDPFFLVVKTKKTRYKLFINQKATSFLPQFSNYLKRKKILVIDNSQIVERLLLEQSLYS